MMSRILMRAPLSRWRPACCQALYQMGWIFFHFKKICCFSRIGFPSVLLPFRLCSVFVVLARRVLCLFHVFEDVCRFSVLLWLRSFPLCLASFLVDLLFLVLFFPLWWWFQALDVCFGLLTPVWLRPSLSRSPGPP